MTVRSFTRAIFSAGLVFTFGAMPAAADTCESHFSSDGVPLVSSLTYSSWELFVNPKPKEVLGKLAAAVAAEGFSDIRVDMSIGAVSALQEATGSGPPQTLQVVVGETKAGSRVDAVLSVPQGQTAPVSTARSGLCRIIAAVE
jgi:hypothetical protein